MREIALNPTEKADMAIPQAQVETWTNQGATTTAEATHVSIRYALKTAGTSTVSGRDIDIFLQGSYRNATNIYSDSDVDVVVLLNETFTRDASRLVGYQQAAERDAFEHASPPPYPWDDFRRDVLASLRRYYGASVQEGNNALKVAGGNGRLAADVVPAVVHKLYSFYGVTILTPPVYIEGISFWNRAGNQVVNYPKEHIKNGQAKNGTGRTNGNYKPIVRMFKNARRYLVEKGRLQGEVAPSYFVECLLYNVSDHRFVADRQVAMRGIVEWLLTNSMILFRCQNGEVFLFGVAPEQWNIPDAERLVAEMGSMWNNWPI